MNSFKDCRTKNGSSQGQNVALPVLFVPNALTQNCCWRLSWMQKERGSDILESRGLHCSQARAWTPNISPWCAPVPLKASTVTILKVSLYQSRPGIGQMGSPSEPSAWGTGRPSLRASAGLDIDNFTLVRPRPTALSVSFLRVLLRQVDFVQQV